MGREGEGAKRRRGDLFVKRLLEIRARFSLRDPGPFSPGKNLSGTWSPETALRRVALSPIRRFACRGVPLTPARPHASPVGLLPAEDVEDDE
jgi:hypothetical protein